MSLDVSPPAMRRVQDVQEERRAEQDYFDAAYYVLEEKRSLREAASGAAADGEAAYSLKQNASTDATLRRPSDAVAFLRLDQVGPVSLFPVWTGAPLHPAVAS